MSTYVLMSLVWGLWGFSMGYLFGDKIREMLWRS